MINKTLSRRIFTEIIHKDFFNKDHRIVFEKLLDAISSTKSSFINNIPWKYGVPKFGSDKNPLYNDIYTHKFLNDSTFFLMLCILFDIKEFDGKNYYFEEEFINSLEKANDNIPLINLPEFWTGSIISPKGYFIDDHDSEKYDGILISIHTDADDKSIRNLFFCFVNDHDSKGDSNVYSGRLLISTNKTVEENILFCKENNQVYPGNYTAVLNKNSVMSKRIMIGSEMVFKYLKTILNMIFYLHCDGIEVDYIPSKRHAKSKEIKDFIRNGSGGKLWNKTLHPVVHVYPSFVKFRDEMLSQEREFYIDKTFVKGHMRFYRVGKGRKDIVYKWRVGHIRHFKQDYMESTI